jgi:hypothetical protein
MLVNSFSLFGQQSTVQDNFPKYFDEIQDVTKKNQDLWNYDIYAPVLLVNPATREIFANFPDSASTLKKAGTIYTGILPKEINIANTHLYWNGVDWAMAMLPLPTDKNERLNLLTHELFHRAQPHLGFVFNEIANNHLDKIDGRIYLRLELEALKAALTAKSKDDMRYNVMNALVFRKYRYNLYPNAERSENQMEMNEGLAEFTGVMMSERKPREMQEHFIKNLDKFILSSSFVRYFAYQTIPIYGYLLHFIDKGWNKKINTSTNLTEFFIVDFNISIPDSLGKAIGQIAPLYGGQKIIDEEILREKKLEQLIAEYKAEFITHPHLDIPLQKMGISFDPRNITPLEDKGSVYTTIRVTDVWGILTVAKSALVSQNWNKITVTAPTQFNGSTIQGAGWTLELKKGYSVQKDETSGNFILKKQ